MQSSITNYAYYNDIDAFCCKVLRKNIALGHLPGGKVDEKDIREVTATDFMGYQHIHLFAGIGGFPLGMSRASYPNTIRTITGGFPCTDISNAGKRAGITGKQSGLWKEMYRLIQEAIALHMGPDIIILENVSALINRGLSTVLGDLAEIRYDASWTLLRASDFGAPQQRERVFIVAYPSGKQSQRGRNFGELESTQGKNQNSKEEWQRVRDSLGNSGKIMAYANDKRRQECNTSSSDTGMGQCAWRAETHWTSGEPQSFLGRMLARIPNRMDRSQRWPARPGEQQYPWEPPRTAIEKQQNRIARLKALGNAIVPQCVEYIARCIIEDLCDH